jgi:hypothetical protein
MDLRKETEKVSVNLTLEDNGRVRVLINTGREKAVSDVIDPVTLLRGVCETAGFVYEMFDHGMSIEMNVSLTPDQLEEKTNEPSEKPS